MTSLLGVSIVSIAAVGALLIWHVRRRGRLIRERLSLPRDVGLPEFVPDQADDPQEATPT